MKAAGIQRGDRIAIVGSNSIDSLLVLLATIALGAIFSSALTDKVELPVKQIVSGKTVQPSETLLNPKSLHYYYRFAKIEEVLQAQAKL
ncbi:acetoacetyl-CoA synthetase-like protein [Penicillium pulvis]|uniref:acetoacetyl-CoA synthetase-like protein n=1 Tax=Penicillium pulvis TaxID=1562058 RepID=UPI002548F3DF|nr:acetoacetyl-CoA synthetase-like protein [Penicillium pulvis]KAJ5805723.1 acetoacetyl-CoA synthetase-like protein [Penicillium pulvis]